ncbi:MAG: peptide ABC transporter substrate-binding protein [Synergistaceae bacterium]|nr:peptide ABC transporter substrate-binding protein [Synergistaceae bacterium]
MRKLLIFILVVMTASSSLAADSKSVIVFNLGADPRTIDPALNNTVDGNNVISNIFEGLVRTSFNDSPEPGCAESWEVSKNGMKWTFHLRDNLKWSDGKPITASEFRKGFLRAMNPETAALYAYYTFFIKNAKEFYNSNVDEDDVGVYAPDDKTLIIELEYTNPLTLDYIAFPIFVPARDFMNEDPSWAAKPETLISNGPFKLESWKHGDGGEIVLVKNHEYWDADNVKVDKLRFVMINDSNTALAAFKSGRIDYMSSIPSPMLPMLLKTGQAISMPALGTAFCDFNVTREPFNDPKVRRAFTLAIDRKIIIDKILMGGQRPAVAFVCDVVPGTTEAQDFRSEGGAFLPERADIEQARKLLAEAGYPNGKNFPKVSYKYNSNPGNKSLAEALQGMWKSALGIEVELLNEEWKVFIETRIRRDYDIARDAWLMDFFDAGSILELCITDSAQNNTGYSNRKFDDLMRKANYEMDHVKRINYMHEAEKILMNDLPVLPIYFYSSAVMQSRRVKNIYHSPRGFVLFRGAEVLQ